MDVDGLFQLPLDQFTAARNALAGRLKKSGRVDDAASVRALDKPTLSAWAVNQLYWRYRAEFERLIKTGEQFVKAQGAQLSGGTANLHAALDARREALSQLAARAADVLRESGHPTSSDTMRRITTTLEALATYGHHPDSPHSGRLTEDIDPPGFEALAALIPMSISPGKTPNEPTRVLPFKNTPRKTRKKPLEPNEADQRAERAEAQKRLAAAESALKDAAKAAAHAETALKKAAAAAKAADERKQAAEAHLEKAAAAADEARQEARRVAVQAEEAAQVVADAERAVEEARRRLSSS